MLYVLNSKKEKIFEENPLWDLIEYCPDCVLWVVKISKTVSISSLLFQETPGNLSQWGLPREDEPWLCLSCRSFGCQLAQPCPSLPIDPVDLGPIPWIDFLAWPVLSLWTRSVISGRYLSLITLNCSWLAGCFPDFVLDLPYRYELSCWSALLVEPGNDFWICSLSEGPLPCWPF